MPFLTSPEISALALQLLRRSVVLPATVTRLIPAEFAGPSGGQVKVRVPRPRVAHEQAVAGSDITFDVIDEDGIDVALTHLYNAALVNDEDLTLDIENFGAQCLMPSVAAIAEASEQVVATALLGAPAVSGIGWAAAPDPAADVKVVLQIREHFTDSKVPANGRTVCVSPDIATRLLSIPLFVQALQRGDGGNALQSANVGHVYGIDFVESITMPPSTAVAYHTSGCVFANVPPAPPGGGSDSTTVTDSGLSLRHVLQFDPSKLATASIVSVFAGASVVTDQGANVRAFKIAAA